MGRGKVDYKRYMIKPQRNMSWTRATQYMLQSPENVVVGVPIEMHYDGPAPYHFRISDGVLQYRPIKTGLDWSNAAGHDFVKIRRFDAVSFHDCSLPRITVELDDEESDLLDARLEAIEAKLDLLSKPVKRGRGK